ncbi:hypothetical protein BST61_g4048 [Cercospora zeina]
MRQVLEVLQSPDQQNCHSVDFGVHSNPRERWFSKTRLGTIPTAIMIPSDVDILLSNARGRREVSAAALCFTIRSNQHWAAPPSSPPTEPYLWPARDILLRLRFAHDTLSHAACLLIAALKWRCGSLWSILGQQGMPQQGPYRLHPGQRSIQAINRSQVRRCTASKSIYSHFAHSHSLRPLSTGRHFSPAEMECARELELQGLNSADVGTISTHYRSHIALQAPRAISKSLSTILLMTIAHNAERRVFNEGLFPSIDRPIQGIKQHVHERIDHRIQTIKQRAHEYIKQASIEAQEAIFPCFITGLFIRLCKVIVILKELHLAYILKVVDIEAFKEDPDAAPCELIRGGPALEDPNTGIVLWESGAIVEYLEETYDKTNKLRYTSFPEVWHTKQWAWHQFGGHESLIGQESFISIYEFLGDVARGMLATIENHLSSTGNLYLIGDRITYADLLYAASKEAISTVLMRSFMDDIETEWRMQWPRTYDWYQRLITRDSVKKTFQERFEIMDERGWVD